ncbi:MAG TPA: dTDP-glucose 4,6-dehydratase [Armatimonadaceae bacterium]|nr:dTDP-glucose 4,6-dehydratase [Armatimonadaceae bacterium]
MKRLLVTGGAGFIGSNFVRYMLEKYPDYRIIVLDALTYAGNTDNFHDLWANPNFQFFQGRIEDPVIVDNLARNVDAILNFAAESHNDRAILDPETAQRSNFNGVGVLLEAARKYQHGRFLQVSTDEVYGSTSDVFREGDALEPNQPYSAAKAGGELLVRAYNVTFGLNTVVTRGSNTYGPYHYPEKLIPLMVTNAIDDQPLPVYGDGKQVREWMYVLDHCKGIDIAFHKGEPGGVYNVGGDDERYNIDVVKGILSILGKPESLIRYVTDRPGHDRRYAMDLSKIRALGFEPERNFDKRLEETVKWYVDNEPWWRAIKEKQAEFKAFYQKWYAERK